MDLPHDLKRGLERGIASARAGYGGANLSAADVVRAKRLIKGEVTLSPGDLRKAKQALAKRPLTAAERTACDLWGGVEAQGFYADAWDAYTRTQEDDLIAKTLERARANPLAGLTNFSSHFAIAKDEARSYFAKAKLHAPSADMSDNAFTVPKSERVADEQTVVVPLDGPMMLNPGWYAMYRGACSTRLLAERLRMYADDETVTRIIIKANSGGGEVLSVDTVLEAISYATETTRVDAFVETTALSAAYWVISATQEIAASRLSYLGSIGVFLRLEDISKLFEEMGIKVEVERSGAKKALGQPGEPITDLEREEVRGHVADAFEVFLSDVAANRGGDFESFQSSVGDGAYYRAPRALELGLADSITNLDSFLVKETV